MVSTVAELGYIRGFRVGGAHPLRPTPPTGGSAPAPWRFVSEGRGRHQVHATHGTGGSTSREHPNRGHERFAVGLIRRPGPPSDIANINRR